MTTNQAISATPDDFWPGVHIFPDGTVRIAGAVGNWPAGSTQFSYTYDGDTQGANSRSSLGGEIDVGVPSDLFGNPFTFTVYAHDADDAIVGTYTVTYSL